ncbi:MAG TPA: bifunctional ADP-heptose synthase [Pyrinomonadaceae bacterium]|nr:bifunctional ADP-heptose synthase [Pyrinomonadaceae bacterium]
MKRFAEIVSVFSQKRLLVIGDTIADRFVYGEISRVSREAPVFILRHEHTETTPGGAANCAANLAALGARVALVSVIGKDEPGQLLLDKLETAGIDCPGLIVSAKRTTTTKMRVLAGQTHSTRQQVIRIDYDGGPALATDEREQLKVRLREEIEQADAVIISDYNYGVVDVTLAAMARDAADQRRIPVFIDSRFRLSEFPRFTSATPNEDEIAQLSGTALTNDLELEALGAKLREQLVYRSLLVTRGSRGMVLFEPDAKPLHIEAVGSRQPVDVTGAGDTVIAAYALAIAAGASFAEAAQLANFAGGIVVMKRGTATVSAEELSSSISQATE